MHLSRYYCDIPNLIGSFECDRITNLFESNQNNSVQTDIGKVSKLSVFSESDISCTGTDNNIIGAFESSNLFGFWKYDFSFIEPLQCSEYFEGDYYNWHTEVTDIGFKMKDSDISKGIPKDIKGKERKLTMIVSLNDSSPDQGGELELQVGKDFKEPPTKIINFLSKKGNAIVFPSYLWYRITPVKSGSKSYITTSAWGDPFK